MKHSSSIISKFWNSCTWRSRTLHRIHLQLYYCETQTLKIRHHAYQILYILHIYNTSCQPHVCFHHASRLSMPNLIVYTEILHEQSVSEDTVKRYTPQTHIAGDMFLKKFDGHFVHPYLVCFCAKCTIPFTLERL